MNGLRIDFDLALAYGLPGAALVLFWAPFLNIEFDGPIPTLTLLVVVFVSGMLVSILRFVVVDGSFSVAFPLANTERFPHYKGITRAEIDYSALACNGVLAAYSEAQRNEKRPYQFYGNLMIVGLLTFFLEAIRLIWNQGWCQLSAYLFLGGTVALLAILYPACRRSYFRFNSAVVSLNALAKTDK